MMLQLSPALIWFIHFLDFTNAWIGNKKKVIPTQPQDSGIVINLNTKTFTNQRMKMGPGFLWDWKEANFTDYHFDNSTKLNNDATKKCKLEGDSSFKKSYCFEKISESYEINEFYEVGDPITCYANKNCTVRVQAPYIINYKTSFEVPLSYEECLELLDPKLPPNINIKDSALISDRVSISFKGQTKKTLIFKPLYWSIYGIFTYESESLENAKEQYRILASFPIVLPDGTMDGIFKLINA